MVFLLRYTCQDSVWKISIKSREFPRWLKDLIEELNCTGIIGIKEYSRVQVRLLMLNTISLITLHNIQQDLIDFIPVILSLLMPIDFLLASEINCNEF